MPVIVGRKNYKTWLDPSTDVNTVKALYKPYPDPLLAGYKVSIMVNSPNADDPDYIKFKSGQNKSGSLTHLNTSIINAYAASD